MQNQSEDMNHGRCSIALVLFVIATSCEASAADVRLSHVGVYKSGTEGYHTFRIPAVAVTGDGTLLAFAEGRVENASDPGTGNPIDTVVKQSTDGGQTWSAEGGTVHPQHPI